MSSSGRWKERLMQVKEHEHRKDQYGYKNAISGFLAYPQQKKGEGRYFAIPLQKSAKDPSSRKLWLVYTM